MAILDKFLCGPKVKQQRFFRSFTSQDYHRINTDGNDIVVNDDDKTEGFDKSTESRPLGQCSLYWICLWVCALVFVVLLSTYLIFSQLFTDLSAYPTDLPDARPNVVYEERVFTGRFNYNESSGLVYREVDPSSRQYFGEPSPEIDAAWDDLLRGEFVPMTEEEANPYKPELRRIPGSGFYFEPDVFHSLHCLNAVRKALDRPYYSQREPSKEETIAHHSPHFPDDWHRIHIDHCLDQLRQSIQCHGDLSPVPLYTWEGVPIGLGVGQTHTCRKWEPIKEWMDKRASNET